MSMVVILVGDVHIDLTRIAKSVRSPGGHELQ